VSVTGIVLIYAGFLSSRGQFAQAHVIFARATGCARCSARSTHIRVYIRIKTTLAGHDIGARLYRHAWVGVDFAAFWR